MTPPVPGRRGNVLPIGSLLLLFACSAPSTGGGGAGERTVLTISAAASLADLFGEVEVAFESLHPGVDLTLNLGGSSALREQVLAGAPVDLFAAASREETAVVVRAGLTDGEATPFARNRMVIAVPAGNPAAVAGLDDFAREELLIGLCAAAVPCGVLARRILAGAGVEPSLDTEEPNARALLGKLAAGELDAGLVYATDAAVSAAVQALDPSNDSGLETEYTIVILSRCRNPEAAGSFVAFLLSAEGRALLDKHGFGPP